ncbi:hypothetical protein HZC35_03240 [Candidatus Saganbacteria bacterium]|nr:hypothetical protein [Candidatus Saganbacteria bacterium]
MLYRVWMKNLAYTILLLMSLGLSACSPAPSPPPETPVVEERPAQQRSALYVYQAHDQTNSPSLTLYMGAEPVALASGYVRLAGVIAGKVALVEIGGRGAQVGVGDSVGDYSVQSIEESEVKLCLKK